MNSESMTEIMGKRKVDETTRLEYWKIYREQVDFEEKIKKANENIVKYAKMRNDLWEYDKQKLLEFCWRCVFNEQETDIEIILNKFRDFNGKYNTVKEKNQNFTKKKTNELAENYDAFCWKKESSNENDNDDKNENEEKCLWVINLDKINVKDTGLKIKKKKKTNNNMTIWDYVSLTFIIILAIICWVFVIWFFIFAIKTLFEPSSWEINLKNPTNTRRMGKIIFGIIALILIICKK